MMKTAFKKIGILSLSSLMLLLVIVTAQAIYARAPSLYIQNHTGVNCHVVYLANEYGHWENPASELNNDQGKLVFLDRSNLSNTAVFHLMVGEKLGKAYCDLTIRLRSFDKQPTIIHQMGHCEFSYAINNELIMTIEPPKDSKTAVLLK